MDITKSKKSKNIEDRRFYPLTDAEKIRKQIARRQFYPIPSDDAEDLMRPFEDRMWALISLSQNRDYMNSIGAEKHLFEIPFSLSAIAAKNYPESFMKSKRDQLREFSKQIPKPSPTRWELPKSISPIDLGDEPWRAYLPPLNFDDY